MAAGIKTHALKSQLDALVAKYNQPGFIAADPVSIPHHFTKPADIEIAGLFAALLAWGQRTTIIKNANRLMDLMDAAPHDFIMHHKARDRKRFESFVHRTFQPDDLLYFIEFLQHHYRQYPSMENLFTDGMQTGDDHVEQGLIHFHRNFFSLPHLSRTEKHVQTPERKSACKRMNLFLRWMVRSDTMGVDFGIWKNIQPGQLLCPLDVHVHRAASYLGLIDRKQADWITTVQLTKELKKLDPMDPVKYDFALFGLSLEQQW